MEERWEKFRSSSSDDLMSVLECASRPDWFLGGGATDVLGAWSLGSLADIELDAVAFAQVLEPFARTPRYGGRSIPSPYRP